MNTKGEWRVLRSWNMVFNRTKDGEVCEILVSSIDDTEYQNALQEIKKYEQQLIGLASEISIVEERERRRIASALHDSVGQTLAMARMQLRVAQKSIKQRDLYKKLDQVCDFLAEAINQTRSLAIELSPPILQELGFEAAIDWLVNQMNNRHGMSIRLEKEANGDFNLNFEVTVLLYQAVRELLFNVLKHAQVKTAKVLITRNGGTIKVSVTDSGVGFDLKKIENTFNPEGFGLFSIRERLKYSGGKMEIESTIGRGTNVEISIPVEPHRQKIVKNS
jgi:signal transduction histidine kinase